MEELLKGLTICWNEGRKAAIATVVDAEGSVYRREGARCLIFDTGEIWGVVSGGCVEKDLFEHTQKCWSTGASAMYTYDFRSEEDLFWGMGAGCNGSLQVWLQPFDPFLKREQAQAMLDHFERRVNGQKSFWSGTILESNFSSHPVGTILEWEISSPANSSKNQIQQLILEEGAVEAFVEFIDPRIHLLVFGAGADAVPVVQAGKLLKWKVSLVDHRENWLQSKSFEICDELLLVPREGYHEVPLTPYTYAVIMTHQYDLDQKLIRELVPAPIPYLGLLGPRKRLQRILQELGEVGTEFSADELAKLHSPIGLDIGAESPEEIALSIVAEVMCSKNQREGISLHVKGGALK